MGETAAHTTLACDVNVVKQDEVEKVLTRTIIVNAARHDGITIEYSEDRVGIVRKKLAAIVLIFA